MPRKASGEPTTKLVRRLQNNGDIYVYEVTTLYNPKKKYNEHVSSKLLGKIPEGSNEIVPTRPKRSCNQNPAEATRKTVGVTDILDWIGRESGIFSSLPIRELPRRSFPLQGSGWPIPTKRSGGLRNGRSTT